MGSARITDSSTNFFHHDDDMLGGKRYFFLHAEQPPQLRVALPIGALRVENRDIGIERRHHRDLARAVGIVDQFDQRIGREHVGADVAP